MLLQSFVCCCCNPSPAGETEKKTSPPLLCKSKFFISLKCPCARAVKLGLCRGRLSRPSSCVLLSARGLSDLKPHRRPHPLPPHFCFCRRRPPPSRLEHDVLAESRSPDAHSLAANSPLEKRGACARRALRRFVVETASGATHFFLARAPFFHFLSLLARSSICLFFLSSSFRVYYRANGKSYLRYAHLHLFLTRISK